MRAGRRRGPLPGARDPHRHPVRGQQQQGQQVEQPERGDCHPIAGPPAPPAVSERVQQQPCGGRREHGDQPVGTRVLGVLGHLRGGHEQQPRHDSGQGGRGQSAGLGKMPANRRYEHSRHRHRQHRRPPQRGLRRSRHGGPDVHEHVVGAVDRISVTRQREDPRQRAAGRVHRVGLITPQRNPPQPVTINQQQHQPGNQQRHPARHLAYPARLIRPPPHQPAQSSPSWPLAAPVTPEHRAGPAGGSAWHTWGPSHGTCSKRVPVSLGPHRQPGRRRFLRRMGRLGPGQPLPVIHQSSLRVLSVGSPSPLASGRGAGPSRC